jgi:hypothetical protein
MNVNIKVIIYAALVTLIFTLVLTSGCLNGDKHCQTNSGIITGKAAIPDPGGWGCTKYTITVNNTVYEVSPNSFAKARIGNVMSVEECWYE